MFDGEVTSQLIEDVNGFIHESFAVSANVDGTVGHEGHDGSSKLSPGRAAMISPNGGEQHNPSFQHLIVSKLLLRRAQPMPNIRVSVGPPDPSTTHTQKLLQWVNPAAVGVDIDVFWSRKVTPVWHG